MKISPIASGGLPGQSVNQPSTGPDKRSAAKQAFLGNSPANITESDSYVDPQVERANRDVRKIKMRTNASPERFEEEAQALPVDVQSAIPDVNIQNAEPAAEVTQPISPQLAALAKQRRELQVQRSEMEAQRKAWETERNGSIDLGKLKANPLSVLQEAGVTYEQLTEAILNGQSGANPDIEALRNEIKSLKEGFDKNLSERDQQVEKQVLSEMQREADRLVFSGDDFEMIRENGRQKDVVNLIHRIWKESGEVLDVQEAAELVEKELLNDALKLARIKKVQSQLTPAQEIQQQQPRQMRTLTNRDTATAPMSPRARALLAARGQLK